MGFSPVRFRWRVERTFAWFGQCRLLAKECEKTVQSAEAWLWCAMTRLLVRRLAVSLNPAFEGQTGLHEAVGRTIREMHPDFEQVWVDRYGHVARSGQAARFIESSDVLGRWFDVIRLRC